MAKNKGTTELKSHVEGRDLVIERVFNAPRELVFKVHSEAEHLAKWWGPKGWETKNLKFEFMPNGVWHYCMTCKDKDQGDFYGMESWGKAIYQEIVPPEKIVYTDVFSDAEGNVSEEMPALQVTMHFEEYEGKTKLVTRTSFDSEEALQKIVDMGVIEGTSSQFECLDEYLREIQ